MVSIVSVILIVNQHLRRNAESSWLNKKIRREAMGIKKEKKKIANRQKKLFREREALKIHIFAHHIQSFAACSNINMISK